MQLCLLQLYLASCPILIYPMTDFNYQLQADRALYLLSGVWLSELSMEDSYFNILQVLLQDILLPATDLHLK